MDSIYHSGSNGYTDTGNTLANIVLRDHVVPTEYLVEEVPIDQIGNAVDKSLSITNISTQYSSGYAASLDLTGSAWIDTYSQNGFIRPKFDDNSYIGTYDTAAGDASSRIIIEYPMFSQSDILYTINVGIRSYDVDSGGTVRLKVSLVTIDNNGIVTDLTGIEKDITYSGTIERTDTFNFTNVRVPAFCERFGIAIEYIAITQAQVFIDLVTFNNIQIEKVYTSAIRPEILQNRTSKEFMTIVYHYSGSIDTSDKILKNAYHATSQSLGLYYSSSLIPAQFNDDDILQINNAKYYGCKLTASDININSNIAAINNTPVIEVYETNANQLIFTENSLAINNNQREPGNLRIR